MFHSLNLLVEADNVMTSNKDLISLQKKTEFLIGRLTDMLSRESEVKIYDLYWSNKFAQ